MVKRPKDYRVEWHIELVATSARDAASQAMAIMRDEASLATCFDVYDEDGNAVAVDLLQPVEEK